MKVAMFSTKSYTRRFMDDANGDHGHEITYLEARLSGESARLAEGHDAVCAFVNDDVNAEVLNAFHGMGVRIVALRSAGYNNVDLETARDLGLCVCRVPAYSPHAVAEHAVGLMLALNRRIHRAHQRVREWNFSLEGLLGFDMRGKTVGVVGTGRIGVAVLQVLAGFGCELIAFDPKPNPDAEEAGARYVALEELFRGSDVITLHCPLTPETHHLVDWDAITTMKRGVMIVNTSRGAIVDTKAAIAGLKTKRIGYLGLDVYEEEEGLFFEDLSNQVIQDDTFARLLTFPNVIVTAHQAYFTEDALRNIAETTLGNLTAYGRDGTCANSVLLEDVKATSGS
jgi:D-lactate dehydrogenase